MLPRVQLTISSMKTKEMNSFQNALCDVFTNDLIDANHKIADALNILQRLVMPDTDPTAYDESLRQLGKTLGFVASRPDSEFNTGPDVLWVDKKNQLAIAFETKIKKLAKSSYSKKEIGQSHDHLQWLKDNVSQAKLLGLAIVGRCTSVDASASPSEAMIFLNPEGIKKLATRMRDLIQRINLQTPLERRGSIDALGDTTEYDMNSIWIGLRKDILIG